jgi:hypothetical protein
MHARVKKLNPHANTPAAVKMNEINPKYENTLAILVKYFIFYATFINCHQAVNRFIGLKNLSKLSSIAQLKRNSCQKIWIRCIAHTWGCH